MSARAGHRCTLGLAGIPCIDSDAVAQVRGGVCHLADRGDNLTHISVSTARLSREVRNRAGSIPEAQPPYRSAT